jgi:hypothetical protein
VRGHLLVSLDEHYAAGVVGAALTNEARIADVEGRLGSAVRGQTPGLRPTPPYKEFGRPAGRVPGSGRQRAIQTTPGSRISKPSKNRSMSFTGRT